MKTTVTKHENLPIANISNQLAFNLSWNLTFREWNVVLFLISKLDSKNQKSFDEQVVSVKELESALKSDNKKWGGLYHELEKLRRSLLRKPIDFYTDVTIEGKPLMGGVNFFEMIIPERKADGIHMRFKFTGSVKPLLLELNRHFVSIPQDKTKLIKNGHAIRFLIAAKAKRDMMRKHEAVSTLRYTLDDFRMLLGIAGKYPDFRNFKRAVINKIEKEINDRCDFLEIIKINFHPIHGKPKTEVEFEIGDRNDGKIGQLPIFRNEDFQPDSQEIKELSRSKLAAYYMLTEYGVNSSIAFRQLLTKVNGSEFVGFEDWYIEALLQIFDRKTKKQKQDQKGKAGAFVKWFLNTSFSDDQFSEVLEGIHQRKKLLQLEQPVAWENRQLAKDMTAEAFEVYYRENKGHEENKLTKAAKRKKKGKNKGGTSSISDILKRSS